MAERTLSVVIPAYNEEAFLGTLLERIRRVDLGVLGARIEVIVVDDGSRDRTVEIAREAGVRVHELPENRGKGGAVRAGIDRTEGDFVIIQDADLEYDPEDYAPMLRELLESGADAVYGSRYLSHGRGLRGWWLGRHPAQGHTAYLGGRTLSFAGILCCGHYVTDTVTALKLFPGEVIRSLPLETSGFELDHEITARVYARGGRIREVPISYAPRSRAEGKKIGLRDWFTGWRTFWRYRGAGGSRG